MNSKISLSFSLHFVVVDDDAFALRLKGECMCVCVCVNVCLNGFRPIVLRDTYIAHHLIIHGMAQRTRLYKRYKSLTHKDFVSFYIIFFLFIFILFLYVQINIPV